MDAQLFGHVKVTVRVPRVLHGQLQVLMTRTLCGLNDEMVRSLRERLEREGLWPLPAPAQPPPKQVWEK